MAQAPRDGTYVDRWDRWQTGLIDVRNPHIEADKFPGTIIPAKKPRERYGHLTAKPVDLLRHLIRISTVQTAVVFDPFAGSGPTGVAAQKDGREFLGIEIDRDMANIAKCRLGSTQV